MVVAAALAQAVVTVSAPYSSGRKPIHVLLSRSADVLPPHATYTIVWPWRSVKPEHDARYILYPRRQAIVSRRHTLSPETARSRLRAAGAQYVIVLTGRAQSPAAAKLAAALRAPWSHVLLRSETGDVYRVDP